MPGKHKPSLKELRDLLHAKIGEKRIQRSSKTAKEHTLERTLRTLGIDKDKFKADVDAVQKQGGFTMTMNNK